MKIMSGCRALILTSLLLLLAMDMFGQNTWDLALSSYRSGEYDKAIQLWDSIGVREPSAAVYYNLGNAWYEKSDIPHAVLYFEKALLLDPGHRNARENLEQVRQQIEDPVPVIRGFFLSRWWKGFSGLLSPNAWAFVFLTSFCIVIALWILGMFGRIKKRIRNYGVTVFLLITVISGSAAQYSFDQRTDQIRAVVVKDEVRLYTSPDEMSPVLRDFPGGTVVRITDKLDNWLLIVLPNMEQGWVLEAEVERI